MKILSLAEDDNIPATEGFVDTIKGMFSKTKKEDDDPRAAKAGRIGDRFDYQAAQYKLEEDLNATYDLPEWVNKNLGDNKDFVTVPAMAYANAMDREITNPAELLRTAKDMVGTLREIYRQEKPFIELRQKLIKQIQSHASDEYAEQCWTDYGKSLATTSAQRFFQKHKKNFPALAHSPKNNNFWPVSARNQGAEGFTSQADFKTSGKFEAPSKANAASFANAIRGFVELANEVDKMAQEARIPYWEFLKLNYDNLEHGDEIYNRIASGQQVKEFSSLCVGVVDVLGRLSIGLYIVMFSKRTPPSETK